MCGGPTRLGVSVIDSALIEQRLPSFIAAQQPGATGIEIRDVKPISSVGNARQPYGFTARWLDHKGAHEHQCVMLLKAEAGQLETTLPPEFHTVRLLGATDVPVARARWLDDRGEVFGSPFFVTDRVPGSADMSLARREPDDAEARHTALHLAEVAARLHAVDWHALGVDYLPIVDERHAAHSQLDYWYDIFERQRLEPLPVIEFAFAWLREHAPAADRVSIVHGDFRFGNLIYDGGYVQALLDWEMVHLGDPLEDLAWCYRPLWSLEKFASFDEFIARYELVAGRQVDRTHLQWYQLFAEVKHSMISLTAARSFADRRTQNIRHADRAVTVTAFMRRFMELHP